MEITSKPYLSLYKAEGMFLQALFYYVWLEMPPATRNMKSVMDLLSEAEVTEKDKVSDLDARMSFLEATSPLGSDHPAVKQYNKCMRGAGDTIRSIIISANSRLAKLENKQVMKLLSKDDLNLAELGTGVNADGRTKSPCASLHFFSMGMVLIPVSCTMS